MESSGYLAIPAPTCPLTALTFVLHLFSFHLRYQSESAQLSHWLQSALDRLEFWTTQSVTVPQELETVRDHLYAFLVRLLVRERRRSKVTTVAVC